jgi:hypothetical protein
MPAILDRLVRQLKAKGKSAKAAYAIATSALRKSGNLKKGSTEATAKGKRRGKMTPGQRAKDRAAKYSKGKHKASEYNYNPKTNRSRLKG